ncbi:MAG: class A beta-lactamase [Fimbriimonadaceae bacterium]|nr:class A beta-lactamase [Fimbriimonadaceae bacterium]
MLISFLCLAAQATQQFPALDTSYLQMRVREIESELPKAKLGVAIRDESTGESWLYRGDERFPMQSTFKMPLGVVLLRTVEKGSYQLATKLTIQKSDLSVPYSQINRWFFEGKKEYTLQRILQLTVQSSDNTGADILMRMLGGPAAVTKELTSMGVRGIRIDRYERDMQRDACGLGSFTYAMATDDGFAVAMKKVSKAEQKAAMDRYLLDPQDTATPKGMMDFLRHFRAGAYLKPGSMQILTKMLTETTTGKNRLISGLPKGSTLAHKTGTGRDIQGRAGAVNDLGIATLPNGRKIIIVALLAGAGGTDAQRERAIAEVARAAVNALR